MTEKEGPTNYQEQILRKILEGWELTHHSRPACFGGNHFTLRRGEERDRNPRSDTIWKLVKLGFIQIRGNIALSDNKKFSLNKNKVLKALDSKRRVGE